MSTQRHSLIPAVFLVFRKDDNILFLRRFNTGWSDGMLTPPSGHVEKGEKFTDAAIREANEEVGVTIKSEDLQVLHIMQRRVGTAPERIDVYFLVARWTGELWNAEPEKASEILWAPLDSLPSDLIVCSQRSILKGFAGISYSEDWS